MTEAAEEYKVLRWEYLECHNAAKNQHKYYLLVDTKSRLVVAKYGRINYDPQQHVYTSDKKSFDSILQEKLGKGYLHHPLPPRLCFVAHPGATISIRQKEREIEIVTAEEMGAEAYAAALLGE